MYTHTHTHTHAHTHTHTHTQIGRHKQWRIPERDIQVLSAVDDDKVKITLVRECQKRPTEVVKET
jgi:hypothetical protein